MYMVNMASRSSRGTQSVLTKLKASLDSGNYYEAHQMYRTLYFRHLAHKDYATLLDFLYDGSKLLLEHDQQTSGADLGILFVDVLNKSKTVLNLTIIERIADLFRIMKAGTPERETFLHDALRLSIEGTTFKWGHPYLHMRIAHIFWKEKNYVASRQHFVYSNDGFGCALMLVELHQRRGYSNEVDLFIAQVVLQYLCLQNKVSAQDVFDTYTSRHPKIHNGPPYQLPLLNFLYFLLKTIETGKLVVFTVLCEQYKLSLSRDSTYRTYLDKIGLLFFGVPPPRPRNQGLLGSLLMSCFNGLDGDDSDEESQQNAASTSQTVQDLD